MVVFNRDIFHDARRQSAAQLFIVAVWRDVQRLIHPLMIAAQSTDRV